MEKWQKRRKKLNKKRERERKTDRSDRCIFKNSPSPPILPLFSLLCLATRLFLLKSFSRLSTVHYSFSEGIEITICRAETYSTVSPGGTDQVYLLSPKLPLCVTSCQCAFVPGLLRCVLNVNQRYVTRAMS